MDHWEIARVFDWSCSLALKKRVVHLITSAMLMDKSYKKLGIGSRLANKVSIYKA